MSNIHTLFAQKEAAKRAFKDHRDHYSHVEARDMSEPQFEVWKDAMIRLWVNAVDAQYRYWRAFAAEREGKS